MKTIQNLDNINDTIKKERLNLLVVSYGGSASNTLVKMMEKNNYRCNTNIWDKILCHCPHYVNIDIPIIYIYDNPIKSFLSMKRRGKGFWDLNQQKLSNNKEIELSDENLIKLMINQFNSWAKVRRDNVLVIKTSEIFENKIVDKLEKFLKKNIKYFPISKKSHKTTNTHIDNFMLTDLAKKYMLQFDEINNL